MVLTETINYHSNYIGAIRTNKDRLKDVYNVKIIITNRRFGEYREVDIIGFTNDIRNVKKNLQEIVDISEIEYQQYRTRNRARDRLCLDKKIKVQIPQPIKSRIKKSSNPFEALNDLDDDESVELPDISSSSNKIMSWADMMD
tara:strand:- start:643 stop:1071 length:429 start_codon:yes stop_codon:yes gene_type:complete